MPHKCTKCGKTYEDGSEELLKGCGCGNRLFLYLRKITEEEVEKLGAREIKSSDAGEVEEKGETKEEGEEDHIWNVKVEDGVFQIDVASLMAKEPVVLAGEEGRYLVSLSSVFGTKDKRVKYLDRIKR
ncbi:MAG: Zn-ribbon domain-containing protein [Candidatus Hydrothermarchaeaceae archaeon]